MQKKIADKLKTLLLIYHQLCSTPGANKGSGVLLLDFVYEKLSNGTADNIGNATQCGNLRISIYHLRHCLFGYTSSICSTIRHLCRHLLKCKTSFFNNIFNIHISKYIILLQK